MKLKFFGSEPVVWLNTLSGALGLVVALGITPLTDAMAGGIVALVTAVLGAIAAWKTRPVAPQAFTTVIATAATLLATFGYDATQTVIGAVNMFVLAVLTLLTRGQVSPAAVVRDRQAKADTLTSGI